MNIKIIIAALFSGFTYLTGIYDFSVPSIAGGDYELSEAKGKTIMIITLPSAQNAENADILYTLDTIAFRHRQTLKIIAVNSFEDGFNAAGRDSIIRWQRSKLDTNIIITEGMYTRKNSPQQAELFKWLTDVNQNEVFDIDVSGPKQRFFIKKSGELYGVLVPETKVFGRSTYNAVRMFE